MHGYFKLRIYNVNSIAWQPKCGIIMACQLTGKKKLKASILLVLTDRKTLINQIILISLFKIPLLTKS